MKEREGVLEGLLHKLNAAIQPHRAKPRSTVGRLGFEASDVDNKAIGGA